MAKTVNLKIDGKDIGVPEGTNLIDAAAAAGIHIPNLCYMKGMKGIGACRLCLVEVEGMKAPMIGCTTRVREGMSVRTNTEAVQEVRKFVIDLILSMHPLDCMTCTKAGVCNLQQYAYDFGLKESTFTRKKFGFPIDEANPFVKRDPDYCVLCGRCVRICKSQGTEVLDFNGRGVGSRVVTANDKPLQESSCTFCGSCIDVCPVNAILESDRWRKGREWEYEKTSSTCLSCGNGCSVTVSTRSGEVVKINTGAPEGSPERYLCAIGRFGFDSAFSDMRVTTPMKRVNGALEETTWEDALALVSAALKDAKASAAVVSSANILNEDALALKKFAAEVVGTKDYDSSVGLYADPETMNTSTVSLEAADLIVLVGLAPNQWTRVLPALDAVVRKRLEAGAKLIVLNAHDTRISGRANVVLRGDELKMIKEIGQAMISKGVKAPKEMVEALAPVNPSDEAMQAADIFMAAKEPVILAAPEFAKAAENLSLIKGDAVAVPFEANAKGVVLMGFTTEGKSFGEIMAGKTKALYVVGEVPVSARPETDFLIVQTPYMTGLAAQADVVLPAAGQYEADGSIVDYLGRVKEVHHSCEIPGGAMLNSDIVVSLAKAMGATLKAGKEADVKKLLKTKAKPVFSVFKKGRQLEAGLPEFVEQTRKSALGCTRLIWLSESEKAVAV